MGAQPMSSLAAIQQIKPGRERGGGVKEEEQ